MCLAIHTTSISQFAATFNDARNRERTLGWQLEAVGWQLTAGHLLRFAVTCMFAAEAAVLAEFEPLARLLLVLGRAVVAPLALVARQRDDVSHWTNP
jgi:hypothetical protein